MISRPSSISRGSSSGADALGKEGVEGAAERDVDRAARRFEPARVDVGRHVPEADGANVAGLDAGDRLEAPGGAVDNDARLRLDRLDHAGLERPGDERDRAVAAGGRVAGVVEEDDAEVGAVVLRLGHEAAVHVRMAARLVDEQLPDVVEVLERVPSLVEDRPPGSGSTPPVTMRNGSPPVW